MDNKFIGPGQISGNVIYFLNCHTIFLADFTRADNFSKQQIMITENKITENRK